MDLIKKIRAKEAKISVVGLGYVGLPLAIELAKKGFEVVGIERDGSRVDMLNRGESYLHEISNNELNSVVSNGKFHATQKFESVSDMDVIIICVPTPLDINKSPVTKYIEHAVNNSIPHARKGQLFVLESTTYPGTTDEIIKAKFESKGYKIGEDIFLAFSPERVDPGNEHFNVSNIPKVVGGATARCSDIAKAVYEEITSGGVYVTSSPKIAEMEKLLENIFRIVNISLVNEMAILCDKMGIDIWEVIGLAKTKPYGFMPFYPGPGTGGHCIPLDPFYLSWKAKEYGISARFIELAGQINDNMPGYVVNKVSDVLNEKGKSLKGSRILIIGMAYKKNINDTRESPAVKVAKILLEKGVILTYHDPYINQIEINDIEYHSQELSKEQIIKSDLVLITTAHSNIDYGLIVENSNCIYDTRNALSEYETDNIFRLGAWCAKK